MLNLFKRKDNIEENKIKSNSAVEAEDVLGSGHGVTSEEEVETTLSLPPAWNISEEEVYVYRFLHNDLPPLSPGQLALAGFELERLDNQIAVAAFVRSSLENAVKLEKPTLSLIKDDGTKLARKQFDLSALGEIPNNTSRPWGFVFDEQDLLVPVEDIPSEGWTLAFELKERSREHQLDLADSWRKEMADNDIKALEGYVHALTPPQNGEVNFLGIEARVSDEGNLHITMLIRNGSPKKLNLSELPLKVLDATGDMIAVGSFKLGDFHVKGDTSKPWTFIFPKAMLTKENIDLSEWQAFPDKK